MPRSAREISSALESKGFVRRESKDAYYHLWVDGKKTPIFTKMSQGERDVHDGLLAAMARQLRLRRRQLDDLVDCPLSRDEYVQILRETGHIGQETVNAPVNASPPPGLGKKGSSKKKVGKKRRD